MPDKKYFHLDKDVEEIEEPQEQETETEENEPECGELCGHGNYINTVNDCPECLEEELKEFETED